MYQDKQKKPLRGLSVKNYYWKKGTILLGISDRAVAGNNLRPHMKIIEIVRNVNTYVSLNFNLSCWRPYI